MNKRILLLFLLTISLITVKNITATEYSNYLPGGKNYLDIENIIFGDNYMVVDDLIFVKANTDYTLTFPGTDMLEVDINIEVNGTITYLSGAPLNIESCDVNSEIIICTFTTSIDEEFLFFELNAPRLNMFVDYYGLENFQLEEGLISTSYEEYIIPEIDVNVPEFSGVGAYITSYENNESITAIISNHISAVDEIDGDLSESINIVIDNYSTNIGIVGDYDVDLSVSDLSGNVAYFTLTVIVKDEINPVIIGPEFIDININDQTPLSEIIETNFELFDEYDSIPIMNLLTDNYSMNIDVLGNYFCEISLTDSSLNITNKNFIINLIDTDSPVMSGDIIHNSFLSNPKVTNDIINVLLITDNYDDLSGITTTIITDGYIGNETIPGTYFIDIEISDSSNNVLFKTLTVNVIDDIAPVISGPNIITSSYTNNDVLNDLIGLLSINDNIDDISFEDIYFIVDTYSNRLETLGSFQVIIGVKDSNNNEATHEITITIFDDIAPVIYVDEYIITVNLNATFNEQDALNLLINSNELLEGDYTILKITDEYSGNENKPGTYLYHLSFTDESGLTYDKEFIVRVAGANHVNIEESLLVRNIIIYSSVILFSGFVFIKHRKQIKKQ